MRKAIYFLLFLFSCNLMADDIAGFWETIDKETKKPSSIIAIYFYQGKYYGRIIGTYNDQGVLNNTIYHTISRAPGIKGNPYYCGLDIVWAAQLEDDGAYRGHVIDPKEGKVYKAELWRQGQNLILRGEVFIFGRNVLWPPFPEQKFNSDFKEPDVTTFVPKYPQVK